MTIYKDDTEENWQIYKNSISKLQSKSGNGTELISLYIPGTKQINDIVNRIRDEYNSCGNIKSKTTKVNVQKGLNTILLRLQQYKTVPENGLIIFCGEISADRGDKTNFEYYTFTPPTPVKSFKYTCDSTFKINEAINLLNHSDLYGLIVLDLKEACWGTLNTSIQVLGSYESVVPSKHGQGGQSQHRFEQLREIAINEYYTKLAEKINISFLPLEMRGIIIGGCGMTKDDFVRGNYLHHELRKKIIGTFDTGYTNEYGLSELAETSKTELKNINMTEDKKIFDDFLKTLAKTSEKVSYGLNDIINKVSCGQVKHIIISSSQLDLYEKLKNENVTNYKMTMISKDTDSGIMLDKAFGGIVAYTRY